MKKLLIIFLMSLLVPMAAIANSDQCKKMLEEKQWDKAFKLCKEDASNGDKLAQYNIGLFYAQGLGGVTKDQSIARQWMKKSAEQGFVLAMLRLGNYYYTKSTGEKNPKDGDRAIYWYEQANKRGGTIAQRSLGRALYYANVKNTMKSTAKSYRFENGKKIPDGETYLGEFDITFVTTVKRDIDRGLVLLEKAAKRGDVEAQFFMAAFLAEQKKYIDGYKWFLVSQMNNVNEVMKIKKTENAKSKYLKMLTKEQIKEAEKWAAQFKPMEGLVGDW